MTSLDPCFRVFVLYICLIDFADLRNLMALELELIPPPCHTEIGTVSLPSISRQVHWPVFSHTVLTGFPTSRLLFLRSTNEVRM